MNNQTHDHTENRPENKNETISANPQPFSPPRHWVGLEELDSRYWDDPKALEKRGQEFFDKPIEYLEKLDQTGKAGMARRDFLTIMGASMAMATFSCARRPVHKIIPYVINPEGIVPGVPEFYASTSKDCPHGCGVLIKTREGRPIKLEGNPDHPMNGGKLCSQAQASILSLYDPDRVKAPLARDRGTGSSREVGWQEADSAIASKLKGSRRVRLLTGELRSDSTGRLVREFLGGLSGAEHVEFEPLLLDEVAEAQALSYGTAVMPRYCFERADVVLSLGSDFLGTGRDAVENAKDWSKKRKVSSESAGKASMSRLYCFEAPFTITGASADYRYPIRPGDELRVALAIAHQLIVVEKKSSLAGDAALEARLSGYKPEVVAAEIGLSDGDGSGTGADAIKKIAADLWQHRGSSLVVAGSIASRTKDALALQLAANLLNSALENEGVTVDGTLNASAPVPGARGISKLMREMSAGTVGALVIARANPAFTLAGFEDALRKVPFVVVISQHDDETAKLADYVLPDHHFLENWGDMTPRQGLRSLQQPAISPIFNSRAFEDSLIAWAKAGAGGKAAGGAKDWHEYLRANWKQTLYKETGAVAAFDDFWEGALRAGVIDLKAAKGLQATNPKARAFKAASLSQLPKYEPGEPGLHLALYSSGGMYDGRHANNPWIQELPEPISSATWDNYLAISPDTAKKLDIKNDDVLRVTIGDRSVKLPVYIQPGMHSQALATMVGWGRRSVGKVGDGAGVDVYPFTQLQDDRIIYSGFPVSLAKTQEFYKLATTQWHTVTENRPVINDITLAQFRENPAKANDTDPELRPELSTMWPLHKFPGYRWGMAIDLSSCISCGACMIGCQAENNVPVVGREQVRVSRQMHWIRIDRYYSGTPENPDVVFQPMLCQHCENAPCETVCPVLATVTDDEGLNVQVYNRCVGTRYCQNNCPYKVRRFNFFDQWKAYTGVMNMAWNPDVTVRTRGIMEKCTFCTQRITQARDAAQDRGEKIKDGDFQTACQQTCPTDAIVFGDINNPNSRVSRLRAEQNAFRALETLNTRPSISYLTKVRNKERDKEQIKVRDHDWRNETHV